MVSSHMIYRAGAFDHFDSILCVGPHHIDEIRAWEKLNGLPAKRLHQHGYAPLDPSWDSLADDPLPRRITGSSMYCWPSWDECILERRGTLGGRAPPEGTAGCAAHPMTTKSVSMLNALSARFRQDSNFVLEKDTAHFRPCATLTL